MTEVISRYSNHTSTSANTLRQGNMHDIEAQRQLDNKLNHLDDKVRTGTVELEGSKLALEKLKTQNKDLETQLHASEEEKKALNTKIGSIKVKLALSNANLNVGNDDKEALRANLNEELILVARMEERLASTQTELDRLRDPANPESNMSIRKHIVNDKKEIKRLKAERETEHNMLAEDSITSKNKDEEIKRLEQELVRAKLALQRSDEEKQQMQYDKSEEIRMKRELLEAFIALQEERKSYEGRLKDMRVKLGTTVSGQNVAAKLADDMKLREKDLTKTVNSIERKSKEAASELDVLRNQHKMSKTAQSINDYTRRTQMKRGDNKPISLAQSGLGPVKFGSKTSDTGKQGASKTSSVATSRSSLSDKQRIVDTSKLSDKQRNGGVVKPSDKQRSSEITRPKPNDGTYVIKGKEKIGGNRSRERTKDGSVKSQQISTTQANGLVPPPKPKLGQTRR